MLTTTAFIHQVLRVYPNSPGSRAGLKAYFDFIVAIGNTRFNRENGSLREILKASVDQKLQMVVYNTRTKKVRETEIVPSTNWGGNGLLGVSIKHSSFDRADERVWHVVEVEPGSPAQQAGFQANDDYVIGSDSILQENDDLYNLVEAHEGKALKLFVYNTKTDNCREVICHPNSRWGGKGLLGCEFGHGLLHRIPYEGGLDVDNDNHRASLLRNEHKLGDVNPPVTVSSNPNQFDQIQRAQQGPGHQLLQQALSDRAPQQHQPTSINKVLPPPPPVPQTFAQLATAQFQSQQYQVPSKPSTPQISPTNVVCSQDSSLANTSLQSAYQNQTSQDVRAPSHPSQQSSVFQQQIQLLQHPELKQEQTQQPHQQQQQQQQPSLSQYQSPELSQQSLPTQQQIFQQHVQQQSEAAQYQFNHLQAQTHPAQQPINQQSQHQFQLPQQIHMPQQSQPSPPPLPPQLQHQEREPQLSQPQQTFNYAPQQQPPRHYPAPDLPESSSFQAQQVPPNLHIQQQPNYPPPPPD